MKIFIDGKEVKNKPIWTNEQKLARARAMAVKYREEKDLFKFFLGAIDASTSR